MAKHIIRFEGVKAYDNSKVIMAYLATKGYLPAWNCGGQTTKLYYNRGRRDCDEHANPGESYYQFEFGDDFDEKLAVEMKLRFS